jgi:hypothetical protein
MEVSDRTIEALASAGTFGTDKEEIARELRGPEWRLQLNKDGTYSTGNDTGTWRFDKSLGMVVISIPASYKQGAIDGFNKTAANVPAEIQSKFMQGVVELRLRTDVPGTLWFESNDHLLDSGLDMTEYGFDAEVANIKFVFVKQ